jgi:molybdopterin/thiamine biosynthesis adenylyltransferase
LREPHEWSPPRIFDLKEAGDATQLEEEFDAGNITDVFDSIRGEREYGKWVLFPWLAKLVHYPEPEDHLAQRTARNRNLVTAEEQQKLYDSTVAVFGLSVGREVVKKLVISGIGNTLLLGDHDTLEPSSLNRIDGVLSDIGMRKLDQIACAVSETDPFIKQIHFYDGFTEENAVVIETHRPDILVDEIDYWPAKVGMRALAAKLDIPVFMAADLGDVSQLDVDDFSQPATRLFHGHMSPADLENTSPTPEENLALILKVVGSKNLSERFMMSVEQMKQGELGGLPQLGTTAALGGAVVAVAVREFLLGRPVSSGRYTISPLAAMEAELRKNI